MPPLTTYVDRHLLKFDCYSLSLIIKVLLILVWVFSCIFNTTDVPEFPLTSAFHYSSSISLPYTLFSTHYTRRPIVIQGSPPFNHHISSCNSSQYQIQIISCYVYPSGFLHLTFLPIPSCWWYPWFVPDLSSNAFSFSPLEMILDMGVFTYSSKYIEEGFFTHFI